jgi:pyruvate formate lyase activating enzyme
LVLPKKIKEQPSLDKEKILEYLKKQRGMLEGVVFCGGEPTLKPGLESYCKLVKDIGYFIKIDTNGSNPEVMERLIKQGLVDYIAMDIKAPFSEEKYKSATGVFSDIKKIKKSIGLIKKSGIDYEFRSTIIPGIHTKEDIFSMAKSIAPANKYFLQQFVGDKEIIDPSIKNNKAFSYDELEGIIKEIKPLFEICFLR